MQVGSLVETVGNFENARLTWGFDYPKKGDILTISSITKHPNVEVSKKGIVLLRFEEKPNLTGVCDKTVHGEANFVELMPPMSLEELFKEENELTN